MRPSRHSTQFLIAVKFLAVLAIPACGGNSGSNATTADGSSAGETNQGVADGATSTGDVGRLDAMVAPGALDGRPIADDGGLQSAIDSATGPDVLAVVDTSQTGDRGAQAVDAGVIADAAMDTPVSDAADGPTTAAPEVAPDAPSDTTAVVSGSVPPELVGIWQETRSSAGDYTNGFGDNFSITSGFSALLKILPNGSYYWAHLASGVSTTCKTVSYFDQSVGVAVLQGSTLILTPTERRLDVTDCTASGSRTLPNDPIRLTVSLKESRFFYGGLRTYIMSVDGAGHPIDLTLLNRPPTYTPVQPAQPDTFVSVNDEPYSAWQGLWVAASGTDSNFFDPGTGKYYFPELNGSPHQWMRFSGTQYDMAVALQNINPDGACKADVIYYEQGEARLAVTEDVSGQGDHFIGQGRFEASAARLVVRIRECGQDDGVTVHEIPALTAFYRWIYFASGPESLTLDCGAYPQNEWQSLLCTKAMPGFIRRP